jgi:gamma-glutamyltranspeptidase/glutathione hydrolase
MGGSAVDAAIAANAAMGVVEPMSNGIGGDLFAIVWDAKTKRLTGINASGWSGEKFTLDFVKTKGFYRIPESGIHSVTVPGCVAGWASLHQRFGKLPWADLMKPAIYYAEKGFPVTEWIAGHWQAAAFSIRGDESSPGLFLPNGSAPKVGQVFRNPQLAKALMLIGRGGTREFYHGEIAKAIVRTSDKLDGSLTLADLSAYEAEWVEPISTTYRGWTVYELPPNGQGVAALAMLNIMEEFPLDHLAHDSSGSLHPKIEAQKLAYADLMEYVADPRHSKVPLEWMLSKEYAKDRAKLIDSEQAKCQVQPGEQVRAAGDTIYLSVVDREGNMVSLIQSLYLSFGSSVAVEGMGFHLQNRGALFEIKPRHPNVVAPRKRPFHTIIPGFAERENLHVAFGIMGGFNQAQAHAQFISNIVDHEMNIQSALEAPRFTKLTLGGCDFMLESRYSEQTRSALERMGHRIQNAGVYSSSMGGGQAVMHDSEAKVNYGASSPRKDGAAVPEPPPYLRSPVKTVAKKATK